ncbi:MAG: preprotein translocase subunit YajC [Acidimicrobiales bacterium]
MGPIISLALVLILFWVLLVLPQRRRMRAQREIMAALAVGDDVMTSAGLYATIVAIEGDTVHLQVADGVVVRVARWSVAQRMVEPVPDPDPEPEPDPDPEPESTDIPGITEPEDR